MNLFNKIKFAAKVFDTNPEIKKLFDSGELQFGTKNIKQPPVREDVETTEALNRFMRANPRTEKASGGRIGFADGPPGKSAYKKPYAPKIEKRIIKLHQKNKLGAQAIADKLTEEFGGVFGRSSISKRLTALKKEGVIKNIPSAERQASIDQRGEFFGKPAKEKYLAIREVRDIDKKTRFKETFDTPSESKYNIPKWAKFKVDFKNPNVSGAAVSNIPEKFRGVRYYRTKEAAEKAVAERKKLKLKADVDPDTARKSANKRKYDLIKEVSNNNIEDKLAEFKKGQPLEQAHRLSLEQVKKTGEMYNVMNLGLDFDDPEFVQINNKSVKPFENKLKQLYKEQNQLYKKANNLKTIPKELRKQIELNNLKISTVVDLSGGRVQGLQLDEFTLKPKVTGVNYANVLGFGLYDKPVKQLTDIDRAEIALIMQGQIENEKKTAGATAKKLFANAELLNNVDELAATGSGRLKPPPGSGAVTLGALDLPSMFKRLSPGARKLVGGTGGFILPEVIFYQLDKANRMSKGQSEKEAAAGALESGTLGLYENKAYMEELKKVAESMGIDSSTFDSAYKLNVLNKSYEQNSKNVDDQMATALENQDVETSEKLRADFNKYLERIKPEFERLQNDISDRITGGSPLTMVQGRDKITEEQFQKPFYDMQDVAMEKLKQEKRSVFPKIQNKYEPAEGSMGTMFFDAFNSLTQGAKNLLQGRVIPFASKIGLPQYEPQASEREITTQELKNMDPRELQKFNLGRGFTYDNPVRSGDIETLQYEQPGIFFAGGGIAGLSGGDKSGPPPTSGPQPQGLLSLKNRVKNL